MTNEQFEKLIEVLNDINDNLKLITAKDSGKDIYNLGDVYSQLSNVQASIGDVETAIRKIG